MQKIRLGLLVHIYCIYIYFKYLGLIFIFDFSLMKLCKSHLLGQKPIEDTTEDASQKTNKAESPVLSCLLNLLKILSNITYSICKYFPALVKMH